MNDYGFNYVVFGYANDFYRIPYSEVDRLQNAVYLYKPIDSNNKLLTFLYKAHFSAALNRHKDMPFKSIWNKMMFRRRFATERPICFVFFIRRCYLLKYGLMEYLKGKYPDAKFVCHYQDLVAHCTDVSVDYIKEKFDLVLSFDQQDAKQYSLEYYPLVYSDYEVHADKDIPESDVFFVGKAKDRLDDIISAYERLSEAGLRCDFHITGVKEEDRRLTDRIDYCDKMPYLENLKRIKASRCLLEVMQKGGHGYTLRACEAIMYDRKMLTNNPEIKQAPFFNPNNISVFDSAEDIDPSFVLSGTKDVDYNYKQQLSPARMLEYCGMRLSEEGGKQ